MKKFLLIGIAGVIVGAATVILFRQLPSPAPVAQAATAADKNAMPTMLPEFSLKNRAGESQSIRSWPGKSLIVNFWATWCAPCRHEIPLLVELNQTHAKDNFQVVGIAIDFHDDVVKYADKMKINYPLLIGEQEGIAAADAFGVNSVGLPFTVFTDNKARIVAMHMGELTKDKMSVILAAVMQVNRGELSPERARSAIAEKLLKLPPAEH